VKSCVDDFVIQVTHASGQKSKVTVKQKRVVFWSKNFADKQAIERDRLLRKAEKLLNSPHQYKHKMVGNEAKYVDEHLVDEDGVLLDVTPFLTLDQSRIDKETALDGYYMIVTSELAAHDQDIIDTYRMLWEIEESFRITKSELRARPVFASKENAIRGHFLLCFYALLLLRLIQKKKLGSRIPLSSLIKTMRHYRCIQIQPEQYMLIYKDKNLELLSKYYSKKLDRLYKSKAEISDLFH
jgi:transposase